MQRPPKSPFVPVPLTCGGYQSAGDLAELPDGVTALLENRLVRPGRFPKRPPTTYDNLDNIVGLANFDDTINKVNRLVAIDSSRHPYEKATSGETWSGSLGTISAGARLTDATYYRGVLYGMLADSSGLPAQAFSFDGTNLSSSPFNSAIRSRTITTLNERNYLGYPRVTFTNLLYSVGLTYSVTSAFVGTWSGTNATPRNLTVGSTIIGRIAPTSTAANACSVITGGSAGIAISNTVDYLVWRSDLRGVDAAYDVPFTREILIMSLPIINTAYAAGAIMTSGGFRYRCTTAGTTAGAPPAYTTTPNGTTVDGTAVWTNEGSDVIGSEEGYVVNITDAPDFGAHYLLGTVPKFTNTSIQINLRFKFYNTSTTALTTLGAVDFSLRDSVADGDPSKKCFGQQLTVGDFFFPFSNLEASGIATIDMKAWIWSEILQPKSIRAANTFQPQDFTGSPTGACTIDKRLIGFYRNGFVQWIGTSDPDIPIREEKTNLVTGCLGSLAHDEHNNETFFIAEDDCYRYRIGQDSPTPFCGNGMREEIMNKAAAGWVESQSTYKRPLLHIDKSRLLVFVYTQKSLVYVYDLRSASWSRFTLPNSTEIDCMSWNQNTGNMYFSLGGHGLVRLDYSVVAEDSIDSSATTYPITANVVYRPIELQSPQRFDSTIESIEVLDAATASQSGQTVTASYSYDQGKTYSNAVTCQMVPGGGEFKPVFLSGWESAPSITVKHSHTGKGGETVSCLSPRGVATLLVRRGEYPSARSSPVSSSL